MNPQLKLGIKQMLDSMPGNATGASLNWQDPDNDYWANVSMSGPGIGPGFVWTIQAEMSPKSKPVAEIPSAL
jgi:hypothetical protein